uniref:Uncharacterized protein n=1 Tax=Ditylum brightwellii TaxID=49249 RepID=A0A7S4QL26_9STRA
MRLETHPNSHRKNAAYDESTNSKVREVKGERPSPNTKIVKVDIDEDLIDSYSEYVYGAQPSAGSERLAKRDARSFRSLDVKVEGGSKQTTPPSLKQQAAVENAQKNGGNGEEGFIDSRSRGYGTQSRYQSGSASSGGSDYATDYRSYLDYVDMDNLNGENTDLAAAAAAAAAADAAAAEKAKERAERRARQKKRQEAREKRGKLNENTESRYYRAADGTVKKLGSQPDYLESMMEKGLPIKQWLFICVLLGACAYQLWKTVSGSMKTSGSYMLNMKKTIGQRGVTLKKKGKKLKGRKSGGSKQNISTQVKKGPSRSISRSLGKGGSGSVVKNADTTPEIESEDTTEQADMANAELSPKKKATKKKKSKKLKTDVVTPTKKVESEKESESESPAKEEEKETESEGESPAKEEEKETESELPAKKEEKESESEPPAKEEEKESESQPPGKKEEKESESQPPAKNGKKEKESESQPPAKNGKKEKESESQSHAKNVKKEKESESGSIPATPTPSDEPSSMVTTKPSEKETPTVEREPKVDLDGYNEDDRRAIMMILSDENASDEGEWKSVGRSARARKAARQKYKQSRHQEINKKSIPETKQSIDSIKKTKDDTSLAEKDDASSTDKAEASSSSSSDSQMKPSSQDDEAKVEKNGQSTSSEAKSSVESTKTDAEAPNTIKNGDPNKEEEHQKPANGENIADKAINNVALPTETATTGSEIPSTEDDAALARRLQMEEEKGMALDEKSAKGDDGGWETVTKKKKKKFNKQ